jgi:hypothetical protein
MFPATEISSFRLTDPDQTDESALEALRPLGDAAQVPLVLVDALNDYLDRYTAPDGTAIFHGGSHFGSSEPGMAPTPQQQSLDVVESFATSLTLMLATQSFARSFQRVVHRDDLIAQLKSLDERAARRLTAAMVGLLRSFTINTFDAHSELGKALLRTVNQANRPAGRVIAELRHELRDVIAGLRDEILIGSGQRKGRDLVAPQRLFECGWSWGIIHGTDPIDFADVGEQAAGVASDEPYLYFTMVALDGIADLFTDRTRRAGLLNEEQQRLARALHLRWDLTQQYWSVLADFGPGVWPLEDIPWRTTDNIESDYLSALVAGVAMRNLIERRADDIELDRLSKVLIELTNRGRITRRPMEAERAVPDLHDPGFQLELVSLGESLGPKLLWPIQDYAAVLLKRTVRVASMLKDTEPHGQMLRLADDLWTHLEKRRLKGDREKFLWDQPKQAFETVRTDYREPSWQMTVRVVESLVVAANLVSGEPLRSDELFVYARDMLSEAEHLLDQELMQGAEDAGPAMRRSLQSITAKLQRARQVLSDRPATAFALVSSVLLELDQLAAVREDAALAG